jgi:hypothetical protein
MLITDAAPRIHRNKRQKERQRPERPLFVNLLINTLRGCGLGPEHLKMEIADLAVAARFIYRHHVCIYITNEASHLWPSKLVRGCAVNSRVGVR